MDFHQLREALEPLGFRPWLASYDVLVRRGDGTPLNPDIYIEQCGWGAPGEALVRIHDVKFRGTYESVAKEIHAWVTTAKA